MGVVVERKRTSIAWQVGFWASGCLLLAFLLWLFSAVLFPFVMALVIGYLLDPLANRLERMGIRRIWGVTILVVGSLVVVLLTLVFFTPMIVRQVSSFIQALPGLVKRVQDLASSAGDQLSSGWLQALLGKLGISGGGTTDIKNYAGDLANKGVAWTVSFANGLLSRGAALLDVVSLLIITPVVGFYILLDWGKMVATIDGLIPPRDRETVRGLAHEIDNALAGFLRGQSLVCLFLAAWYGIGLTIIGLNFGLLIGIVGGILSFIPYIGSLVVLVLATVIAIVQGWPHWQLPVSALGIVLVGQFLEGNVLSPKLVGDKVGLHPVWIIFALLGFGSVFGLLGLIVAVPVSSAIGVLLRFATRRYRQSPIYTGIVTSRPAFDTATGEIEAPRPALERPEAPSLAT